MSTAVNNPTMEWLDLRQLTEYVAAAGMVLLTGKNRRPPKDQ